MVVNGLITHLITLVGIAQNERTRGPKETQDCNY